VMSRVMGYR